MPGDLPGVSAGLRARVREGAPARSCERTGFEGGELDWCSVKRRVLLADDSPVARAAVGARLRTTCDVIEADSVAAAKEAARADGPFAAAVLDLDLGDGTGVDVARDLRALSPSLPIAFFSAGAPAAVIDSARGIGRVFAKSADVDALVSWVASVSAS